MNEPQAPAEFRSVPLDDLVDADVSAPLDDAIAGPMDGDASAEGLAGITLPNRRGGAARFITDVIVELGFLPQARVDAAVEEARATSSSPEDVLLQSGVLSADQLARATAERFGLDHVDLTVYKPDLSAVNLLTPQAARRYNAVPIGFHSNGHLLVAMSDPSNVLAIDDLKLMTGYEIRPAVASAEDVAGLIVKMNRLDDAVAEATEVEDEDDETLVADIRESAADAPTIKLVNSIIAQAVEDGASDIHLEPHGRDMRVRFRVDGVLHETTTIPRRMVAGVVSRVKIMADLDIAEKRLPQDGRVTLQVEGHHVDVRIVTLPASYGEGIVMRLLDKDAVLLTLDALGIRDNSRERFEEGFRQSYGAVLVTGPTGSGKSTTLYAALNTVNSVEKNILTIEDPIEYQIPGINQMQVNLKAGLAFATGLRSMLRADPDIIMVGEIRDADTARIAIEAALTGHLVLSTLHTNDAPSAITRRRGRRVFGPPSPASPAPPAASPSPAARSAPPGAAPSAPAGPSRFRSSAPDPATRAPSLQLLQAPHGPHDGGPQGGQLPGRRLRHRGVRAGRLRPLQPHGLQGPRRHLRGDDDQRRDPRDDHRARLR